MDRFTSETYNATPRHFRSEEDFYDWKARQEPEPEEEEQTGELGGCPDCHGDLDARPYENGYGEDQCLYVCKACAAMWEQPELDRIYGLPLWERKPADEPEPVEAQILSACCAAESRVVILESSTCPETGYREEGGLVDVCAACGGEFEPMLQPVFTARVAERKPVSSQQGELFNEGVA